VSEQPITLNARPGPVELDLARTAVVVVDMQNDFGADGGMFARAGTDVAASRRAIAPTAAVLAAARRAGVPVVYLKMGFRPDLSDAGPPESTNWLRHQLFGVGEAVTAPDGSRGRQLIRGTWGTAVVDELAPEPGDVVIDKHRFSGFYETDLDAVLRQRGVAQLVFTGWTTSVCVESTVRDAMFRNYRCVVLEDCTAEPIGSTLPRTNHEATLLVVELLFGWVARSSDLITAIEEVAVTSA
jgi:ureidoacrylate peracid hydrolase